MIDERRLRILETQVDALRTREKDSETRKTYDEVFDHAALLTIADLITDGVISTLDYPVSTGKEANVFDATGPDGRAKAVKIYRIANATFRNIAVYIDGDPRFKKVKRAIRPTLWAWAQKEYKNLVRMEDAGVRVPAPERVHNNVLVMEYIGDETQPAPALREVALEDPAAVYADVLANLRAIRKAKLVHADMSEYNLLWWDGRVVVIDVGQAVPLDHLRAAEWFKRDVGNIARFFRRLRVDVTPAGLERAILGGRDALRSDFHGANWRPDRAGRGHERPLAESDGDSDLGGLGLGRSHHRPRGSSGSRLGPQGEGHRPSDGPRLLGGSGFPSPGRGRVLRGARHQGFCSLEEPSCTNPRAAHRHPREDPPADRGTHWRRGQRMGPHGGPDRRDVRDGHRPRGRVHAAPRERTQDRLSVSRAKAGGPQGVSDGVLSRFPA